MKAVVSGGRSSKCRNICLAATALLLAAAIILLILCLTVFKPKEPETTVNSVVLKNLHVGLNIPRVSVDVNLTLHVDLSVKNRNKVGFKYKNGTAFLNYRGTLVGQAFIGAGEIAAGRTKPMNVTLTIMADRLLGKSEIFSDAMGGTMPFNTLTRVSGKVSVFGIFKIHVVSTSSCDFSVDVGNSTVGEQHCTYKTKL